MATNKKPATRYFTVDLYDGVPRAISKEEFDDRKLELEYSNQSNGVEIWQSEEELLMKVD